MLEYYLGRMYAADVLSQGSLSVVSQIFKAKCAKGTQLEQEARRKLAELEPVKDPRRCFISAKYYQYLQSILN